LLANAVYQPIDTWLQDRIREQARSHIEISLALGAIRHGPCCTAIEENGPCENLSDGVAGGQATRTNPDTGRQ